MTGKELKEWAAMVHDEAVILVREHGYCTYKYRFDMKAELEFKTQAETEAHT